MLEQKQILQIEFLVPGKENGVQFALVQFF
jgi:hypothetical protein